MAGEMDQVEVWNQNFGEGTEVVVKKDIARGKTLGPAFMHRGEAVVMVEGVMGPVALHMVWPEGSADF
ncbi:MAG: hypothetical protein ABSF90_10465 [Syntrophobacteraceae bacterium]|jgi:hypothetical protein